MISASKLRRLITYTNNLAITIGVDGNKGPQGKQGHHGIPGPLGQRGDYSDCVLNPHEKGYLSTCKLSSSVHMMCYTVCMYFV